jgi:hypothetical protein
MKGVKAGDRQRPDASDDAGMVVNRRLEDSRKDGWKPGFFSSRRRQANETQA